MMNGHLMSKKTERPWGLQTRVIQAAPDDLSLYGIIAKVRRAFSADPQ